MNGKTWLIVPLLALLVGCSSHPKPATLEGGGVAGNAGTTAGTPSPPSLEGEAKRYTETGIASWYGQDFQGKETSCGEVYDMFKLTAAHQTIPFHTLVEVTNLENGKKVVVRINDRGPFLKDRIIDLSYKAAQALGMEDKGTAPVSLQIVKHATGPLGKEGQASVSYFLQVGAFQVYENAAQMLERVNRMQVGLVFSVWKEDELYKVFSEKVAIKSRLESTQRLLSESGITSFLREIH